MPGPTRYVEVPAALTGPTPRPAAPEPRCTDLYGAATLCEWQLAEYLILVESSLDQCNADKTAISNLTRPDGE